MSDRSGGASTRVTLSDIAKLAGVSVTTVSRVLGGRSGEVKISEKTTSRILEIAREQNYRPNLFAKALRTNKSHLVGLVVWDYADPFYGEVVVGAQTTLARHGYTAVLTNAGRSEDELCASLSRIGAFQTDGALVVGGPADFHYPASASIRDDPSLTVYVATRNPQPGAASVVADNFGGGRMGVDYLITRWKRPVVCLLPEENNHDVAERTRGIHAAVADHRAEVEFTTCRSRLGEEAGYATCGELLGTMQRPFSLFAFTDRTAVGALHAVRDAGLRVPDDVAILGFDDLALASHINPPLTTIRQPRQSMGSRGAELLVQQLTRSDGEAAPAASETLATELVIRATA